MNPLDPQATSTANIDAQVANKMARANPAGGLPVPSKRIPMSVPTLKLEIPEIPGYKLHWFRGTGQRLQQAQKAGYTFVSQDEVQLNSVGIANDFAGSGNTDMGTRVSVSAGGESEQEQGLRLYLMKIQDALWDEDQLAIDERHDNIAAQLRGDAGLPAPGQDTSNRYSRGEQKRHMFQPSRRA